MIKQIKKSLAVLLLAVFALPAWALSLDQAKSQGLVGERVDGYLGVVTRSPSAEVRTLVADVNSKRQSLYQQRAREAGVTLDVFQLRAGERLQQRAAPGEFVQDANGQWRRK